jgi:hypothetical protein
MRPLRDRRSATRMTTMAKKLQWTWVPDRRLKPKVPDAVKAEAPRSRDHLELDALTKYTPRSSPSRLISMTRCVLVWS